MYNRYSILEDSAEFNVSELIVPIAVDVIEEDYQGTARGEEYVEETVVQERTESVSCPLHYIYNIDDPNEEYTGDEAIAEIQKRDIAQVDIKEIETVEILFDSGEVFHATFDPSNLDEYR